MKPSQPFIDTNVPSKPQPGAGSEVSPQRHPAAQEFVRGLEVTEVVDSLPGELLDLFGTTPPK